MLAAALTSIVMGLRPEGGHTVLLLAAGATLFVPFVLWEQRAGDPVIAFSVFRSATFSAGTVLVALQNLVMYALVFEVPLIAEELFDLGARGRPVSCSSRSCSRWCSFRRWGVALSTESEHA